MELDIDSSLGAKEVHWTSVYTYIHVQRRYEQLKTRFLFLHKVLVSTEVYSMFTFVCHSLHVWAVKQYTCSLILILVVVRCGNEGIVLLKIYFLLSIILFIPILWTRSHNNRLLCNHLWSVSFFRIKTHSLCTLTILCLVREYLMFQLNHWTQLFLK